MSGFFLSGKKCKIESARVSEGKKKKNLEDNCTIFHLSEYKTTDKED